MVTLLPTSTSTATLGAITFGAMEASGVDWGLETIDGWGSPASTLSPVQKPRSDGGWAGQGYKTPRTISLSGWVSAPTTALLTDALDRLNAACSVNDTLLSVNEAGRIRSCTVRQQGEVLAPPSSDTAADWSIQVVALDSRKFAAQLTTSTGLPSGTGGLTVPFTVPFAINSTIVNGQCTLTNPGNANGPVLMTIQGPVVGPVVTHLGSGLSITFAASLSLGAAEFLTIDMENRRVLAQGQASRSQYVTSRGWSQFEPGGNTWSFTGVSGSGTLTVQATPAWL